MPFPVTAKDVQAIIPAASASWCEKMLQYPLRLGYLAISALKFMVNPDGSVTDEFKAWVGVAVDDVTPGQVPTGVEASDGTFTDKVTVTWNFAGTATQFKVYRSTDATSTNPDLIATVTTTTYDDHPPGAAGTSYAYFVKATVNGQDSALSAPNNGYVGTGTNPPPGTTLFEGQSFSTWTVPEDGTYAVEAWGGGGGGGASFLVSAVGGQYSAKVQGGSGGGGGYASLNVTLRKNDILSGSVGLGGRGGTGGATAPTQGEYGGTTLIVWTRGTDTYELVSGFGGGGAITGYGNSFQGGVGGSATANGMGVDPVHGLNPGSATPLPGNPGQPGGGLTDPPPNPLPPPLDGGTPGFAPPTAFSTAATGGKGSTQYSSSSYPSPGYQGMTGCVRIRRI